MDLHSNIFIYVVFALVISLLLLYDLGVFNLKKKKEEEEKIIRDSIIKTFIWLGFGSLFSLYIYVERGQTRTIEYITAFLMEWSLSIDNVFVFILLFSNFKLGKKAIDNTLLIGVILAIMLRIIFIVVGISLVKEFEWIFYVFSVFLIYTGIKILLAAAKEEKEYQDSKSSELLKKWLRIRPTKDYKFFIKEKGRWYATNIVLVIILIALTDITFALDSIPAVLAISQDTLIVYTSNIFAVLGLRSLFFALQEAKEKFKYLPKGIGTVLIFIGLKIFVDEFFHFHIPAFVSLACILIVFMVCILVSSIKNDKSIRN